MGLLNPGALIFAALFAVLVLLYLWERIRRQLEVPSLLLWQAVHEDVVQARKFRPDWLFLLQLLLLAALVFGLARPYLSDGRAAAAARRHVFILDTSASMQAREGRGTRFEAARQALRARIDTLPAGDQVMLMTAAAHPETVVDFTGDHAALLRALEAVEPTDSGTNLDLALAVAAGARQRGDAATEMQLFTDVPTNELPARWRAEAEAGRLSVNHFGATDSNLAITGLQIFQGRFQEPTAASANIVVQNFSHQPGHGVLTVSLDATPLMRTGFSIPPRDVRAFGVPSFPGPGRVVAQIEAQAGGDDALPADNTALGWLRPLATTRVLLVSAATPLAGDLETVAHATAGWQLSEVTPDDYDPTMAASADVVIFHRFVPPLAPASPALYIDPPAHNPLFAVAGDVHGVEVLDWNDRHPAVGDLRPLAALPIQSARVILPAEWQEPLLLSRTAEREFPLAFAGTRHGHRLACIAFDLEAERLLSSDNVNFLLFFLNLVSWLAPGPADVTTVTTGTIVPLTALPAAPATVIDPRGRRYALGDGRHASLEALTAGEYRLQAGGVTRTVYANLFDPAESDIGRRAKASPAGRAAKPKASAGAVQAAPRPGAEFGWWLFAAAAALLLVEWAAAMRRSA